MKLISAKGSFNSLRVVDLVTDTMIVLLSVAYAPIATVSNRLMGSTGFFAELGHLAFLFICFFGIGFMYVDLYLHRNRSLLMHIPKSLRGLAMFLVYVCVIFLLFSLLAIAFAFYNGSTIPTFSALLVAAQGVLLGSTFGLDLKAMERDPVQQTRHRKVIKQGESVGTILPYLVMTFALVFPTEYFLARLDRNLFSLAFPILGVIAACVAAVFLGRKLERALRPIVVTEETSYAATTALMSFLAALSVLSLGVLQSFLVETTVQTDSQITEIGAMFLFGFIPVRVFRILFSSNIPNALIGLATLIFYFLRESHAI